METKIKQRNFTPIQEEEPKPAKVPTLKTKNCFVCGTTQCFNGTTVELDGARYLVRVCANADCLASVKSEEGLNDIKAKGLLVPSQYKASLKSRRAGMKLEIE